MNTAAVCSFAFQFLWKHAVMSKISTVLWNYYYFDLFFPPKNLLCHLSGWIFNTLRRLLSLSGRMCYPAYPCVCILASGGSQVLILRSAPFPHPPCSVGRQVVGTCVEHLYIKSSLFPAPFRIQDIVLAGRECRRSPSPAAHQRRALHIVWCRRWELDGDILQVPSSLWEGQCWSRLWAVWDSSWKGSCLFSPKGFSCWQLKTGMCI